MEPAAPAVQTLSLSLAPLTACHSVSQMRSRVGPRSPESHCAARPRRQPTTTESDRAPGHPLPAITPPVLPPTAAGRPRAPHTAALEQGHGPQKQQDSAPWTVAGSHFGGVTHVPVTEGGAGDSADADGFPSPKAVTGQSRKVKNVQPSTAGAATEAPGGAGKAGRRVAGSARGGSCNSGGQSWHRVLPGAHMMRPDGTVPCPLSLDRPFPVPELRPLRPGPMDEQKFHSARPLLPRSYYCT